MLRILTYHRVLPSRDPAVNPSVVSAWADDFEVQMRFLARRYEVVSLHEVLSAAQRRVSMPRRAVAITFDDAYRDFATIAWPVLRTLSLPVTVFVPTGYPDRPDRIFWWDRLHTALRQYSADVLDVNALTRVPPGQAAPFGPLKIDNPVRRRGAQKRIQRWIKSIPHELAMEAVDRLCDGMGSTNSSVSEVLGWEDLRKLDREGVTLAPHTRSHVALPQTSTADVMREIVGSRNDLEEQIGHAPPIFSYPFGAHDDRVVAAVQDAGFGIALTCLDGQNNLRTIDPLRLRRINVTPRTTPLIFKARLLRPVSRVDQWRHRGAAL